MGKTRRRKVPGGTSTSTEAKGTASSDSSAPRTASSSSTKQKNTSIIGSEPSLIKLIVSVLILNVSVCVCFPFWIGTAGLLLFNYGRPPRMVFLRQTWRYIGFTWRSTLSWKTKIELTLSILLHTATSRVMGFAWLLDEVLYGKALNQQQITEPLFIVSGFRSASTFMARTLVNDTDLKIVAPTAAMANFPYLWLWKLVSLVFQDSGITTNEINGYLNQGLPAIAKERHDFNHFAVDTFDSSFITAHLNGLALKLGPQCMIDEFATVRYAKHNNRLWEDNFVDLVDRLARKTLLFNGKTDGSTFMLKGHFLGSATALASRFHDARFLTVLRDPAERLVSGINYMAVNPTFVAPWQWLTVALCEIEYRYCLEEMKFYENDQDSSAKRLAVTYKDLSTNPQAILTRIRREFRFPTEAEVKSTTESKPSGKGKKSKKRYTIDKSLLELGVNEEKWKERLADYYSWIEKKSAR